MDPVAALTRLGGVARLTDLLALTTRGRIRRAVTAGAIHHVGHSRYALPTAARGLRVAAELGGVASHLCAAAALGWEIARQPDSPQVLVPRHRVPAPTAGVEVRRHPFTGSDVHGAVTSPLLTVLLCARDLSFDEALTVADSALRHGGLDHDDLVRAAASWPAHVRRVAAYADGRAANPFESVLRALAIDVGADVVPQYEVRARGLVLHPDLADPLRGIIIEGDSWGFHASRSDHERDCVRYNAFTATGWHVLRFAYEHAMHSQAYVRAMVAALADELAA